MTISSRSSSQLLDKAAFLLLLWVIAINSIPGAHSFSLTVSTTGKLQSTKSSSLLHMSLYDDSAEAATPLSLTANDIARLQRHQTTSSKASSSSSSSLNTMSSSSSITTMPLLIGDHALLPGQQVTLESSDPSLARLLHHALQHSQPVAFVGLHPHTQQALTRGVAVHIHEQDLQFGMDKKSGRKTVRWTVTGGRTIQLPSSLNEEEDDDDDNLEDGSSHIVWMDPSRSFYMAHIEYLDQHPEPHLSPEQDAVVQHLTDTIPQAMQLWKEWVTNYQYASDDDGNDPTRLTNKIKNPSSTQIPSSPRDRAFWVAAHLNPPHDATQFCLDIRPAMLACRNDYERTILACQALQSSTDHLSGKKRLF